VLTRTRRLRANALLLLASALWGFAFVAQRVGAESVGAFSFNAARFALGSACLVPVVWWLDRRRGLTPSVTRAATRSVLVPGILTGTLLALAVGLQQLAMSHTTAGNAAFLTGLYMLVVPVVLALRGRRSSLATIAGIVLALAGLYLISVREGLAMNPGDLLVIVSTFIWAGQILLIEHYSRRLPALRFSIAQFVWCAVLSAGLALAFDTAPFTGFDAALVPLLYGGVISVGIAYTLQVLGQREALATHAAIIMSCEALFGALGGALLLGEDMGARGYLGAALMMAGVVVAQVAGQSTPGPVPGVAETGAGDG
jgi:drug/metabolite transporter (DMT)-like permease